MNESIQLSRVERAGLIALADGIRHQNEVIGKIRAELDKQDRILAAVLRDLECAWQEVQAAHPEIPTDSLVEHWKFKQDGTIERISPEVPGGHGPESRG